ncbi:MAG: hypothetical protein AAGL98_15410, partial [Planctomycetota bacterium]
MMRSLRVNAVVLLSGLALLFTAAVYAKDAPAGAELRVFASHHYHIHTNLSREETVPYGRHMDAVFGQ